MFFSSLVTSVFVILSQKGIDAFLADAPSSDCHRLASAAAKDPATRTEKVSASSGGSGSHPAQNDTNLPQSLFPRRHGRGEFLSSLFKCHQQHHFNYDSVFFSIQSRPLKSILPPGLRTFAKAYRNDWHSNRMKVLVSLSRSPTRSFRCLKRTFSSISSAT